MANRIKKGGKTKTDLAVELGRAITELKNHLRRNIQVRIRETGIDITYEMLEVLGCLWQKDGINQQEIADLTLRDKSGMTYLIDNLVKRQLVKRVEDSSDRRNKLVYLTEKSIALKDQLYPWLADLYTTATPDITLSSIKEGLILVNKMIVNLKRAK